MHKYVKLLLVTLIYFFFSLNLQAQDNFNFDSLNTALNKTINNKADFLKYLHYIDTLPEENLEIIRVVGSWITKHNNYDSITAATKIIMGNSQLNTSRFKESTALLNAAFDIAEKNNLKFINVSARLPKDATFFYDGYHFTNDGSEFVSEIIYNEVKDLLTK